MEFRKRKVKANGVLIRAQESLLPQTWMQMQTQIILLAKKKDRDLWTLSLLRTSQLLLTQMIYRLTSILSQFPGACPYLFFPFSGSQSDAGRRSMPGLGSPKTSGVLWLGNVFFCWFRTKKDPGLKRKGRSLRSKSKSFYQISGISESSGPLLLRLIPYSIQKTETQISGISESPGPVLSRIFHSLFLFS